MTSVEHIHGGDPERELKRLGLETRDVLDFSVNVSPLGVPAEIKAIWKELLAEVDRYPSVDGQGVVRYYQERFDLEPARVLAGNGSTELIYLTPRALQLRKVAVITPSFHDYTRSSLAAGADVLEVGLKAEEGFTPPATWILVDEAFVQFLDQPEEVSLMRQEPPQENILVFHSLTKFFALPGLRLGAVVGHPDTISRLRPLKEPWSVNRVAEKVALKLIGCANYEKNLTQLIHRERPRVFGRIGKISGFQVFEPAANFLLARWTQTNDLDDFLSFMLRSGIHFRDCRNFPGLEDNFFRMAIRQGEENDRVLSLMQKCAIHYS